MLLNEEMLTGVIFIIDNLGFLLKYMIYLCKNSSTRRPQWLSD
jgi:hypothetical protein